MKKLFCVGLTVLCLYTVILSAGAEAGIITPTYYDHRNDSPLYASLPEGMMYLERREAMSGYFQLHDLVLMDGGGVLLLGSYVYFDILKEESFHMSYETTPPRTEAYAMALNAQGERLWSMRLSDPQAEGNCFSGAQLPDGRFLLKFWGNDSQFGVAYFIVNQAGEIEEMLPSETLRALGVLETLRVCGDAYCAGGSAFDGSAFAPMEADQQIMMLDADLSPIWSLDNPFGTQAYLFDSDMCAIEVPDGTIWYGRYGDIGSPMAPGIIKVGQDGNIKWMYDDAHPYAAGGIIAVAPHQNGGVLVAGDIDPREATPVETDEHSYLWWIDESGALVDAKGYQMNTGISNFTALHTFGDGFVAAGMLDDSSQIAIVYVDAQGKVLGTAKLPSREQDVYSYTTVRFAQSPDGRVYVYGVEYDNTVEVWQGEDTITHCEIYYAELRTEDFIGAQ